MMDTGLILHTGAFGLIVIGIAGIVLSSHLIRIIFGIALLEAGANLLLLLATWHEGTSAPIIVDGHIPAVMADPVPQALVLTAIVIGVGILALALSLALRIQQAWGTLDIREIRQRMEEEIADTAGVDLPSSPHAPKPFPPVAAKQEGRS
ncbi:MAG TPA: Na+/H+ antiporter subunit C [Gammaproteobacteria bacterium]|nr:Na+/H+ antiporter subunit C [Gammaproteobacteria bacterium]